MSSVPKRKTPARPKRQRLNILARRFAAGPIRDYIREFNRLNNLKD